MRPKLLIIVASIFSLLIILVLVQLFVRHTKNPLPGFTQSPTPTPITASTNRPIVPAKILSTFPADDSENIDINSPISIQFSKPIKSRDFSLSFVPSFSYTTSLTGTTLTITPTQPLSENVRYFGFVQMADLSVQQFSFSTISDPNSPSPSPDIAQEVSLEEQRLYTPDQYVDNFLPYQTQDFSAIGNYTNQPSGHFYAFVTLKGDREKSKQAFINWLTSLGITKLQLPTLDIRYQ